MFKEDGKPVLDYCLKQEKKGILFGIFFKSVC